MNPNVMSPMPPQKTLNDVAPPNYQATAQAAQPINGVPAPVKAISDVKPMFPVETPVANTAAAQALQQQPAQAPAAVDAKQANQPAVAQTHVAHKPKINWLVIILAVVVAAGLAFAAYTAFKQN